MNHIVLVNIENNTEKVHRQFSPPFGILIAHLFFNEIMLKS